MSHDPLRSAAALRAAAEWVQAPRSHRIRGRYLTRYGSHINAHPGQEPRSVCVLGCALYHYQGGAIFDDTDHAINTLDAGGKEVRGHLEDAYQFFDEAETVHGKSERRAWNAKRLRDCVEALTLAARKLEAHVAALSAPEPTQIPAPAKEKQPA